MSKEVFILVGAISGQGSADTRILIALVRGAESVAEIRGILKHHHLSRYIGQEERILLQKGTTEVVKSPTRQ
jgi:hypothetical protein